MRGPISAEKKDLFAPKPEGDASVGSPFRMCRRLLPQTPPLRRGIGRQGHSFRIKAGRKTRPPCSRPRLHHHPNSRHPGCWEGAFHAQPESSALILLAVCHSWLRGADFPNGEICPRDADSKPPGDADRDFRLKVRHFKTRNRVRTGLQCRVTPTRKGAFQRTPSGLPVTLTSAWFFALPRSSQSLTPARPEPLRRRLHRLCKSRRAGELSNARIAVLTPGRHCRQRDAGSPRSG